MTPDDRGGDACGGFAVPGQQEIHVGRDSRDIRARRISPGQQDIRVRQDSQVGGDSGRGE